MIRKIFFFATLVFIFTLALLQSPSKAYADCSSTNPQLPAIPVDVKTNEGKVTITIQWSKLDFQTYIDSGYDQGGGAAIPIYVLALDSNGNLPSSVFNTGNVDQQGRIVDGNLVDKAYTFQFTDTTTQGDYKVYLSDPDNFRVDGNHVTLNGCTFEQGSPSFTVSSTQNPGLSEGDQCNPGSDSLPDGDPSKCPQGTSCRSPQGLSGGNFNCLAAVADGGSCVDNDTAAPCEHGNCVNGTCGGTFKEGLVPLPCSVSESVDNGCPNIQTALGSIDTSVPGFVKWLLTLILSLAGGIVILIIITTGYRLMASQGDPEKVKEAREALTAAIVGLLFIIFSLVILQFITLSVLHIPAFSAP